MIVDLQCWQDDVGNQILTLRWQIKNQERKETQYVDAIKRKMHKKFKADVVKCMLSGIVFLFRCAFNKLNLK